VTKGQLDKGGADRWGDPTLIRGASDNF
jgi:hypothetical protein